MSYKYIQELLSTATGTKGTLLIPQQIYDTLIEETEKNLIPRSEAGWFISGFEGSDITLNLGTPNSMDIRVLGEGAEAPIDQGAYTSTTLTPVKYGVALRITSEMLEDNKWKQGLWQNQIRLIGKRFAEKETELVITALDSAANTISGGAAITIANLTRALQYLNDNDYKATTILIGNEVLNDLQNIDTFLEAEKFGNREMLEKGIIGRLFNANVMLFSTNAAPSSTYSKYAYVFDNMNAYAIAEKRPISIEQFRLPIYDMDAALATQRIAVKAIRTSAIVKITTS